MIVLAKPSKVSLKCTFLYPKKCNILNFDVSFEYFTPNDRRFGHFFKLKLKPKNYILMSGDSSKFDHVVKYKKKVEPKVIELLKKELERINN